MLCPGCSRLLAQCRLPASLNGIRGVEDCWEDALYGVTEYFATFNNSLNWENIKEMFSSFSRLASNCSPERKHVMMWTVETETYCKDSILGSACYLRQCLWVGSWWGIMSLLFLVCEGAWMEVCYHRNHRTRELAVPNWERRWRKNWYHVKVWNLLSFLAYHKSSLYPSVWWSVFKHKKWHIYPYWRCSIHWEMFIGFIISWQMSFLLHTV